MFNLFKKKKNDKKQSWAKYEIDRVKSHYCNDEYNNMFYDDVLELYNVVQRVLEKQGHSGFSYSMAMNRLQRLLDRKPLTPIEDEDFDIHQDEMVQTPRRISCQ